MLVDGKEVSWPSRMCLLDWQCKLSAESLEGPFRMVAVAYPFFAVTDDRTEGSTKLEGTD